MKATKRSWQYRLHRRHLQRCAPTDVWIEREVAADIVAFSLASEELGSETLMAFVVRPETDEVLGVSILRLEATADGWQANNLGPASEL